MYGHIKCVVNIYTTWVVNKNVYLPDFVITISVPRL